MKNFLGYAKSANLSHTLFSIAAAAFLLRILTGAGQDLWDDEVASILVARAPILKLGGYYGSDPHPPLFFTLLKFWTWISLSTWWVRIFPALIGSANIVVIYFWAKKAAGKKAGLLAAGLIAAAPFHVWASTELRSHILVALFVSLGGLALFEYLQKKENKKYLFLSILFFAFGSWSHYFGIAAAFGGLLTLFILSPKRKTHGPVFLGVYCALCLPWAPFFFSQLSNRQFFRKVTPLSDFLFSSLVMPVFSEFPWKPPTFLILNKLVRENWYVYITILSALALLFWSLVLLPMSKKRKNSAATLPVIILGGAIFAIFAGSRFVPGFESRYMVFIVPPAIISIVSFENEGLSFLKKTMLFLIVICFFLANIAAVFDGKSQRPDFSNLVEKIEAQKGMALIYNNRAAPGFLRNALLRLDVMELRSSFGNDPGDVKRIIDSIEPGGRKIFFVGSNKQMYDPDKKIEMALRNRFGDPFCHSLDSAMTISVCEYKPMSAKVKDKMPGSKLFMPF